ncbi:S41 family peptidase [Bacteroidales bacterium OttesenSCG-928-I21]|nr:S41 family peptidase [Bacteroidales bacterium OttesenSCG-928-I21]
MKNRSSILIPLIIAVSICIGIVVGNFFALRSSGNVSGGSFNKSSFNKINSLLDLIEQNYVDTVNMHDLIEEAIPSIIAQLDPHSAYITSADLESVNEDLEGSFSGIGVQFNIQNDTVLIVAVIPGGPSEKLGIMPGDRIVEVNDSVFVGKKITNEFVQKTLRGKKGTSVKVGIKRYGTKEILPFDITRNDIPVNSVDVSYMIDNRTGYVKISKFGAKTYQEFLHAIGKLKNEGASQMILDFRGNPGGYMGAAINMINEFLPAGNLIVYTEGKTLERENYFADGTGSCLGTKVVVLIDEWSASASEIFAGAVQDNDRGTIIGRRSFGKGLVQTQIEFPDSSAIRLTIARYYTPSGRSIQKPYVKGDDIDYENDILNRFNHGEFDEKDSISVVDSVEYRTKGGKIVYGGGGIMPDVFVPRDTTGYSSYYNKLINHSIIYQYALEYVDKNRDKLKPYKNWKELTAYLRTQNMIDDLTEFASRKDIRKNIAGLRKSEYLIQNLLEAYIARMALSDSEFYPILNQTDSTIKKALEVLNEESDIKDSKYSSVNLKNSKEKQAVYHIVPENFYVKN